MQITADQLAKILGATIKGDPNISISGPAKIEEAGPGTITFFGNKKYESYVYTTKASIIMVPKTFEPSSPISSTLLIVDDVYAALSILLAKFGDSEEKISGIHASAVVGNDVQLAENAAIGANSVIGDEVVIEDGTILYPQVYVGKGVKIGKNCTLYPGVKIYQNCVLEDNVIIHSNAVIGSDGFGFVPNESGSYDKIPQVGNVHIESDVEIGAGTIIDRGSMGSTRIKKGVKLDNLIQIAHNVEIGSNTVIAAQAGIAGSTKLGENCKIGGQAGFVGHITVADGTMIQAQSGVASAIKEEKSAWYGSPAISYRDYLKSYSVFKKLPEMTAKIRELERKLKALEAKEI